MKEENKYINESKNNFEENSEPKPLPFLNQDFEEIAAQFTNFIIFLSCNEDGKSLCKNN